MHFIYFFYIFLCMIFLPAMKCKKETLDDRVQELVEMSSKRPVLSLTGDKFRQFIKATPKNYSFVVMFTALSPHHECVVCRHAFEEFHLVANSYCFSQRNENKIFFGTVDFDEVPDVFISLRINSTPVFIHFPENRKLKKGDQLDIQRIGFQAKWIARWIEERTDIQIRVFRPFNYSAAMALVSLCALVATLVYMRRNNLNFLWGLFALFFVFAMTSGQMFNHMHRPPFMHHSSRASYSLIHGSSSSQFIVETYIVIALYSAIVLGVILLHEAAASRGDLKKRKSAFWINSALGVQPIEQDNPDSMCEHTSLTY